MKTKAPAYTVTNDSITVIWDKKPVTVPKTSPQFKHLKNALLSEDWDSIPKHLTVKSTVAEWAKGKFTVNDDVFSYDGVPLPSDLNGRILAMAAKDENPTPLLKFWEHLQKNPSWRSVEQLWPFLRNQGISFTEDGCFLAYKGVRNDYKDLHSGRFDNRPGVIHEMPRNRISDDPNHACHVGFHVGALEYARSFGGADSRVVVCKVNPADVVCVPYDENHQKMRVCKYEVIGNHNGRHLPETVYIPDEVDIDVSDLVDEPDDVDANNTDPTPVKRKSKRGFAKFDKMDMDELMLQSVEELRRYATVGLQITGASKILGGKTALVSKILEVRR